MAWLIQSQNDGPILVADIGLTFTAKQIKNVDLIGRQNAEKSTELKWLMEKGFLKQLRKDASEDMIDAKIVQKLNESINQANQTVQQAQQVVQEQQGKIANLETQNEVMKQQNDDLKKQNEDLHTKMDKVLAEVKSFADKFPLDVRVIAEAMHNAKAQKDQIAQQREELAASGSSEKEIATQDKILAMKEKKLVKNMGDMGKTVSQSAKDFDESIDALDQLGL